MSSLSLIPEEDKLRHLPSCINASKSLESLHSAFTISTKKSTSSGGTRRRRSEHTNSVLSRPPISNNEIRQRVMSARVQRVKVLQNQLIDAQHHITELDNENRILRKLHKRQDSALSRYENCSAELPQLLNSHSEEIRMWQTKYKNVQCQNRELTHKLKLKDTALFEMMDKNKHLESLSKDKNLEDREKLTDRVKFMEQKMADKEQEVKVLNRRLQLESKNFRTQICNEQQKYKDLLAKYQKTSLLPSERLSEPKSNSSMLFRSKNRLKTRLVQQKALATNESLSSPSVTSTITQTSARILDQRKKSPNTLPSIEGVQPHPRKVIVSDSSTDGHISGGSHTTNNTGKSDDYSSQSEDEDAVNGNQSQDAKMEKIIILSPAKLDSNEDLINRDELLELNFGDLNITPHANDPEMNDFEAIQKRMMDEFLQREAFLDNLCQTDNPDTKALKSPTAGRPAVNLNVKTNAIKSTELHRSRPAIDPQKKVKLLEALKAIDGSVES